MRLLLLCIIIFSGVVIQTVKSRSLTLEESDSSSNGKIRKKRKLDDVDVINRFELDRVPSLQDAFRNLPPFEKDWINSPPPNFSFPFSSTDRPIDDSSEFKLELSKDEEHVFSGGYGGNSAVNWWYSVESYSNVTHYNFTDTELEVNNILEDRTAVTRKQDEDHVVSRVPGVRSGRWSTFDEVVLESPTTPGVTVTLPPQAEKPKVETRYILLQSGRIVAYNVTSVSNVFKSTSESGSGNKPSLPPAYFGARIRKSNSSASNNVNEIDKRPKVGPAVVNTAIISGPNRVSTQALPARSQNLRYDPVTTKPPPTIIRSNVLTPPPAIRRNTIAERLQNPSADTATTSSPNSRLFSVLTATVPTNVVKPVFVPDVNLANFQALPKRFESLSDAATTNAPPLFNTIHTPPPTIRVHTLPERLQNLRTDPATTKSPNVDAVARSRIVVLTPPPTIRSTYITEVPKTTEKSVETTKRPVTTLTPTRILYSISPETTTNPTTETGKTTNAATKKVFETLAPTRPALLIRHSDPPTTQKFRTPQQVPTKQPLNLPTISISNLPSPKTTKVVTISRDKTTTQIPPSPYSLPPRNIIETIFEVFQPDTSELPFLVVTFDSLKKQSPTVVPPVELTSVENKRPSRQRSGRLIESNVEYEKVRSTKPSLVHYNFNPYHRTSAISEQDSPTTRVLTTTWNRNRGPSSIQVTPPVNSIEEKGFKPTESVPKLQHDFVRINAVTFPTTPAIAPPSPLANPPTTTRRPRYRGVPYITNKPTIAPKMVPPPSSATSRKPRQNQGFHLRNSIGFQTIPPAAFSDRRSLPGVSTIIPDVKANTEEVMGMDQVFRFEPTRKNAVRADDLQNIPTPGVTPAYTIQWFRPTTKKARLASKSSTAPRAVPSTRSPRRFEERARPITSIPLKEINSRDRNFQRQRSQPTTEAELDNSSSTSTTKPFRVYYFEPKRKKQRKNDTTTEPPKSPRYRVATERVQTSTSNPLWRMRADHPQRSPRVLSETPRRSQPPVARSATPSTPVQDVGSPTYNQDRSRRGRARVINLQTSSPVSTTQVATTARPPKKKQWYIPFIRHQPNVGNTVQPVNNQRVTVIPSTSHSTRAIAEESFPLPPGDSFEEVIFQPLEIRRIN